MNATIFDADAPGLGAPRASLRERLRGGTAAAHAELEGRLDLLSRISDRRQVQQVLQRFLGFHIVWERAIRQRPALRSFHEPRSRLPHLRRDLAALGLTSAEQAALPLCAAAADLASDDLAGVGGIYVMEGSTLGGQVIGRAVAAAAWSPAGGLAYFNPYGPRTGEMWRGFQAWAEARVAPEQAEAVVDGANRTFAVLQEWLTS